MRRVTTAVFAVAVVATGAQCRAAGAAQSYRIDSAASQVTIAVGKSGAFSFIAGHTHEVTGPVESGTATVDLDDPARTDIHLVIATVALKVSGADEPPADRPKVQEAMDSEKVLDISRYPRITFDSTEVTVTRRQPDSLDARVSGRLTIRDVTRPVTIPVSVQFAGDGLTARGRLTIKQTEFNIKPISVAGVVTVKDALDISFSIAARR